MRAITACAFAIDAFYATVKERCGPHPHDLLWRDKGTPRKKRITETLRFHMRIKPDKLKSIKSCVAQVFTFRDQAVHMAATFRDPAPRPDIQSNVDWHFHIFRRENAVNAVCFTVMVMDYLVSILEQGGEDLAKCKTIAVERMGSILYEYKQVDGLPAFQNVNTPLAAKPRSMSPGGQRVKPFRNKLADVRAAFTDFHRALRRAVQSSVSRV
jgi:hypothetical protein